MFGLSTVERMSAVHYVSYRRFNRNGSANRKSLNIIDTNCTQFIQDLLLWMAARIRINLAEER
jgi:hypothetical protein